MNIPPAPAETGDPGTVPPPGGESRRRRIVIIGGALVVGIAALFLGARLLAGVVGGSAASTLPPGIEVTVEVPAGASARTIADLLEEAGVISAGEFDREVRAMGVAERLRAGTYVLTTGMSPTEVADILLEGPASGTADRVTVIEGLTINEILASLAEQTTFTVPEFEQALLSGAVTSPFLVDVPADTAPLIRWEGLLYPASYDLPESATPTVILNSMAAEMVRRVESIDWSRIGELGVSRYQAITVASLVEREAKLDEERPLIASVIYNRLDEGMPLQIDATVIYALGENPGRVLADDLEIDSPYNTYLNLGLPPTPIGAVRHASLAAAADPARTGYFFYVLSGEDGSHGFSETYEQHQEKVRQAKATGIIP